MCRSATSALLVSVLLVHVANAGPLDNLRRGAEGAVKKKLFGKEKKGAEKSADKTKTAGNSQSDPPRRSRKDRAGHPPGLSFSSLLNGIRMLHKNAKLNLHHIQAVFLPDGATGWAILRKADGAKIFRFEFKSQKLKAPYFLLDFWKSTDLRSGKNLGAGFVVLSEPGDYVLDFYLPDEHFYTVPFKVSKLTGDDPFAGGDFYFLDGDWEKWGYLYYTQADPTKSLVWKVWLRNKAAKSNADAKIRVEITRDSDGTLVCTNRPNTTYGLKPEWVRIEFDMIFPKEGTSGGRYFKAKDLLGTDGAYTLTMKVNDKPYGTWKFAIADGKLQYAGRTVRGKADPLTFIEGGRDAWWYCKTKP